MGRQRCIIAQILTHMMTWYLGAFVSLGKIGHSKLSRSWLVTSESRSIHFRKEAASLQGQETLNSCWDCDPRVISLLLATISFICLWKHQPNSLAVGHMIVFQAIMCSISSRHMLQVLGHVLMYPTQPLRQESHTFWDTKESNRVPHGLLPYKFLPGATRDSTHFSN